MSDMTLDGLPIYKQVYSHRDLDGVWRHFNIEAIEIDIKKGFIKPPLLVAALEPEVVEAIRANSGLERRGFEFAVTRLDEPLFVAQFDDESVIVIDGNHRMVARYDLGYKDVHVYMIPRETWEQYLIQGIPDDFAQRIVHVKV